MKHSLASLITALGAAFGTAQLAHAEVLIGVPAPITGPLTSVGEEIERGVEMVVTNLNQAGGVLGQEIRAIMVDDYCDPDQAVAAAEKLIADGVDFVIGHVCSGAAIATSKLYAQAGILMMTATATNPRLTEQGFANVFRFSGRDDQQGIMAGGYLAKHWGDGKIAIVHDGQIYGQGLAEETKRALNAHGVSEAIFEAVTPGSLDYSNLIEKLQAADIEALYYGGYAAEAGLLIRQLRDRSDDLQFIGGDGIATEDFMQIAGAAAEGVLFTNFSDARRRSQAASVVAAFRAENYEPAGGRSLLTYGAIQALAQAVEKAGTLELDAVIDSLRTNEFDTIYGRIGFDTKGDVTGYEPFTWYVWEDGDYAPVGPAELAE
jgi:branched-chain amino acid transport system substrate-binding protein